MNKFYNKSPEKHYHHVYTNNRRQYIRENSAHQIFQANLASECDMGKFLHPFQRYLLAGFALSCSNRKRKTLVRNIADI